MWESSSVRLDDRTVKGTVQGNSAPLSYREVIGLWQGDAGFRKRFTEILTAAPFEAFFWETPPVSRDNLDRPFEFVWVDAPPLLRLRPEAAAFAEHFASHPAKPVLSFPNLGGDAILIVPTSLADEASYTHLARFLRNAPETQVDAFWQQVGEAMRKRISDAPVWLSTAGLGVSWLHLRLTPGRSTTGTVPIGNGSEARRGSIHLTGMAGEQAPPRKRGVQQAQGY